MTALLFREAFRQGDAQLDRNVACRKCADEGPHPDEQLTRGELGEGHSGDGLGRDASGQQHGDATRHDSSLAGTRPGLHQEGAIVVCDGAPSGGIVGERAFPSRYHLTSHICAASPRSAVAAASFRER